ncbi:MAG: NAD-dependent epimerase/dehydratase family protein [Deltaproteobacteria bacterium]|nr:NAD-dependent epimerase/dehydratase family protein [Deltaproteobacteria bacterium]MBI3016936.1 NAD-dependent epimerase/dehydratase family protein [Deltaproteobacteria bacterium]
MKTLVTGGGGFLGRTIVEQLLRRGAEVRILARHAYPALQKLGAECVQGDIQNQEDIERACKDIDVVFHTAAKVGAFGRYRDFYHANVIGTQNILESCWKHVIPKLIFTSSSSVCYAGEDQVNVDETTPYPKTFLSPYSQTKAISEQLVLKANDKKGLLTVSLRPHLIWGPRDPYLLPRVIEQAKKGRLRIIGDGKNLTDISYVENVAQAHLLAADALTSTSRVCGKAYYITQGKPVVMWEWMNLVLKGAGIAPLTQHISAQTVYRIGAALETFYTILHLPWEPPMTRMVAKQLSTTHTYNISRAREDFGYTPQISTEEGLNRFFAYLNASSKK